MKARAAKNAPQRPRCIVGVGVSAGGLAALRSLFSGFKRGSGLAFVVVQHMLPDHPSRLAELLPSPLTVAEATDGTVVAAEHVYIIPPGKSIAVQDGRLRVRDVERAARRSAIDDFLHSLAKDQEKHAVAVILTGSGADGAGGVRHIKGHGGLVVVQDPTEAEYPFMPQAAIATGAADLVLPVKEMPKRLATYAKHPYVKEGAPEGLAKVLDHVARRSDLDLQAYRRSTLERRVLRRMGMHGITDPDVYLERLRADPKEMERTEGDMLIGVTEFFRDPEAFEVLEKEVIPKLFEDKGSEDQVRAWVVGCSTGEEAYSIAMLLLEARDALGSDADIKVLASDVDAAAVDAARKGLYDEAHLENVRADRREHFFVREGERRRVARHLREVVAFSRHDVLQDPPFAHVDLVSCRNLLIYLEPRSQQRLMDLFHFALDPGGHLFLGSSENAGRDSLFKPVSKKWRVYGKQGSTRFERLLPLPAGPAVRPRAQKVRRRKEDRRPQEVAEAWMAKRYAPAAAVVDHERRVVYLHGAIGRYLTLSPGEPDLEILHLAEPGLRARLRLVLRRAIKEERPVDVEGVRVELDGSTVTVRIKAEPIEDGLVVVTFEEEDPGAPAPVVQRPQEEESVVTELEAELRAVRNELHDAMETAEASNEELQESQEESTSVNEELRATIEELEASKEELQAFNAELNHVNQELKGKNKELEDLTADLTNFSSSIEIPVLFLDRGLRLRRWTPATTRVLRVRPGDQGRPLAELPWRFADEGLLDAALGVLSKGTVAASIVRDEEGRRHTRRILPYRSGEQRVEGVVVTFVDIEDRMRIEDQLSMAKKLSDGIVEAVRHPLVVLDGRLRIRRVNHAFKDLFGPTDPEFLAILGGEDEVVGALREALAGTAAYGLELRVEGQDGPRYLLMDAHPLPEEEEGQRVLVALEDVTERRQAQRSQARFTEELEARVAAKTQELAQRNRVLREANEALEAFSYMVGHDLKEPVRTLENLLSLMEMKEAVTPEGKELFGHAVEANRRLARLVLGLLAFSRAARTDQLDLRPVSLGRTLAGEECRERYAALAKQRGAVVGLPEEDHTVLATPAALSQVLGNLVQNAIRHNPQSAPHVAVRAKRTKDGVEVTVEDDGPGFSPSALASFETMGTATPGFGLIIAKRTVKLLGGRMHIANRPEGGAAVHVVLPAAEPQDG